MVTLLTEPLEFILNRYVVPMEGKYPPMRVATYRSPVLVLTSMASMDSPGPPGNVTLNIRG